MQEAIKPRILIIDDEPEICWIMKKVLLEEGYEIHTAFNGEQGLEMLETLKPALAFLDMRLPQMHGLDVLRQVKERNLMIPIVVLSAFEDVSAAVQAMKLGAYDYLRKPLNIDEMFITLKNALKTSQLMKELNFLKNQIAQKKEGKLIWACDAMDKTMTMVKKIAAYEVNVLIRGESGTGKELIGEYIHTHSNRVGKPMISVDCSALPETLIESELFGYERGAFTGANERKIGRFEMAHGGTLLLDEIGNLTPTTQVKLLRVLQEHRLQRLGGKEEIEIDVRLIAATNVNLETAMKNGHFREDLYHRLNEFTITLPPLRDRGDEIEVLSRQFLERFNHHFQKNIREISRPAMEAMKHYSWPGNVRELMNVIKRAVVIAPSVIELDHLPFHNPIPVPLHDKTGKAVAVESKSLKEICQEVSRQVERDTISRVLQETRWNKMKTAKRLKINYKTLFNKMRELGI